MHALVVALDKIQRMEHVKSIGDDNVNWASAHHEYYTEFAFYYDDFIIQKLAATLLHQFRGQFIFIGQSIRHLVAIAANWIDCVSFRRTNIDMLLIYTHRRNSDAQRAIIEWVAQIELYSQTKMLQFNENER